MKWILPGDVDAHCHSSFSFDSEEKIEAYLALTPGQVITTEHLDFDNPVTGRDDVPDYEKYRETVNRLNKSYDNRLLKGIEVGYTEKDRERIEAYLAPKSYDLILFSIHQNGDYDYMDEVVKDMDPVLVAGEYLERVYFGIRDFTRAQVLAHIDYGFRNLDYSMDMIRDFKPTFQKILGVILDRGIAFELNTRSMYQFNNLSIYEYVILLYHEMGGDLYSLGSDAHYTNYYRYEFPKAKKFLKDLLSGR